MSDEIDPVEEVRAVEHARTVGESFMRERLQADSNRRVTMRTQILEPENAFTPEERRILAGPPPPYSREDRDADEQFELFISVPFHKIILTSQTLLFGETTTTTFILYVNFGLYHQIFVTL